jgi:hypothetical protein
MASEQFKKVLEIIKSQPANPNATFAQRRAGMERISERVAKDVDCTPVDAGGAASFRRGTISVCISTVAAIYSTSLLYNYFHFGARMIGVTASQSNAPRIWEENRCVTGRS